MKEYPRYVFTAPGPVGCQGGSYGSELVQDAKEHDAALEAGFFDSIPEALEAAKTPKEPKEPKAAKTSKDK